MTDDNIQLPNDRLEPAKPKQSGEDAQQPQTGALDAPAQPEQRVVPGRRPLFGS
jgi:hypothetical protein